MMSGIAPDARHTLSRRTLRSFGRGLVALVAVVSDPAPARAADASGVIVTNVLPDSAGQRAGIQPGDVLESWVRGPHAPANPTEARGSLETPFDLVEVELEQAPRGDVTIRGVRGASPQEWRLPIGAWGLAGQPRIAGEAGVLAAKAQALIAELKPAPAAEAFGLAVAALDSTSSSAVKAWLKYREFALAALAGRGDLEEARQVVGMLEAAGRLSTAATAALDMADLIDVPGRQEDVQGLITPVLTRLGQSGMESLVVASVLERVAWAGRTANPEGAQGLAEATLSMREELAPDSLPLAASCTLLGALAEDRGDWAGAKTRYERALAITRVLVPDSREVVVNLDNLARVAWQSDDVVGAEGAARRALAIRDKLGEESLETARNLNDLGLIADHHGEESTAEQLYRRSLAIRERLAPGSVDVAWSLANLAELARKRGEAEAAEELYRRSLAIRQMLVPASPEVATTLSELGRLALGRRDYAEAEKLLVEALDLQEKADPRSLDVAWNLFYLGAIAQNDGRTAAATERYRRCADIFASLDPDGLPTADTYESLGFLAVGSGEAEEALDWFRRALRIREKKIPGTADLARSFYSVGIALKVTGDLSGARTHLQDALAIREELDPGSGDVADTLDEIGRVAGLSGDLQGVVVALEKSVAIRERLAPGSAALGESLRILGLTLKERGDLAGGETTLRRALAILEGAAPPAPEVVGLLEAIGDVARQRGDVAGAFGLYKRSLDLREALGQDPRGTSEVAATLGHLALEQGDRTAADHYFRKALALVGQMEQDPPGAATLLRLGDLAETLGEADTARRLYERSVATAEKVDPEGTDFAFAMARLAVLLDGQGDLDGAEGLHRRALAVFQKAAPESLLVAASFNSLGLIAEKRGQLELAESLFRKTLAIRERLAPSTLELAWSQSNLGDIAQKRKDLAGAERWYRLALATAERAEPGGEAVAMIVTSMAFLASNRGDPTEAEALHQRALSIETKIAPESLRVASILNSLGVLAEGQGDLGPAEDYYSRSLRLRQDLAPGSEDVAWSLSNLGDVAFARGDVKRAEGLYLQCLEIAERLAPESEHVGRIVNELGLFAERQGNVQVAESRFRRAVDLREKVAPDSLDLAASLNNVALVLEPQGRLDEARQFLTRAWELHRKHEPEGEDAATMLNNMGKMAMSAGDFDAAEDYLTQSLKMREQLAPASSDVAQSLSNLAMVALKRGDFDNGRQLQAKAVATQEAADPKDPQLAMMVGNLASFEMLAGDLAASEEHERAARRLRAELGVAGEEAARALLRLGVLAAQRGDFVRAQEYGLEALQIVDESMPDGNLAVVIRASLGVATYMTGRKDEGRRLATEAQAKARPEDAANVMWASAYIATQDENWAIVEELMRHSLEDQQRRGVAGIVRAGSLSSLGSALGHQGRLDEAESALRQALAILSPVLPGTGDEAFALHELGLVMRQAGRLAEAADLLCRATANADSQRARLGGSDDAKALYTASVAEFYRDCEAALLQLGQPDRALGVVERSRARSLLEMVAERDLLFASDIPEDVSRERRAIDTEYEQVVNALGQASAVADAPGSKALQAKLSELTQARAEVKERIKKMSPRLAALQYPEALDLPGVQGALDPGTVYLSFSVGKATSSLYIVESQDLGSANSGLTVVSLPIGDADLRAKVQAFRALISGGGQQDRGVRLTDRSPDSAGTSAASMGLALELYRLLLAPAEKQIGAAVRVLISPDGPLHALPFSALIRTGDGEKEEYFIEWKPLHVVVSATVYAELNKARRRADPGEGTGPSLVAFGDPEYPSLRREDSEKLGDVQVRHAVRGGVSLSPLPFTRHEVDEIAGLYGARGRRLVGGEATERAAKAIGAGTDYVHFACHGILDEQLPLNSALALSIPDAPRDGEDNGLLQAWEIFESVRMNVDLVVLSACETGLGKEIGGEGLVGLTRAFQYAGARSVVASLWSVADESTAGLMKEFYVALKAGRPKDEALRQAQLALLKDPRTAHPFHWAAFQVIGDWK